MSHTKYYSKSFFLYVLYFFSVLFRVCEAYMLPVYPILFYLVTKYVPLQILRHLLYVQKVEENQVVVKVVFHIISLQLLFFLDLDVLHFYQLYNLNILLWVVKICICPDVIEDLLF